ncbi:hypothetical protein B0H13DRAFT_2528949 [Mycena leptocephala]|nr:hypothetical protein B0H13DRAFT_2528949 [Mycena leptocephala]
MNECARRRTAAKSVSLHKTGERRTLRRQQIDSRQESRSNRATRTRYRNRSRTRRPQRMKLQNRKEKNPEKQTPPQKKNTPVVYPAAAGQKRRTKNEEMGDHRKAKKGNPAARRDGREGQAHTRNTCTAAPAPFTPFGLDPKNAPSPEYRTMPSSWAHRHSSASLAGKPTPTPTTPTQHAAAVPSTTPPANHIPSPLLAKKIVSAPPRRRRPDKGPRPPKKRRKERQEIAARGFRCRFTLAPGGWRTPGQNNAPTPTDRAARSRSCSKRKRSAR